MQIYIYIYIYIYVYTHSHTYGSVKFEGSLWFIWGGTWGSHSIPPRKAGIRYLRNSVFSWFLWSHFVVPIDLAILNGSVGFHSKPSGVSLFPCIEISVKSLVTRLKYLPDVPDRPFK